LQEHDNTLIGFLKIFDALQGSKKRRLPESPFFAIFRSSVPGMLSKRRDGIEKMHQGLQPTSN
jgi:hypothetical protein